MPIFDKYTNYQENAGVSSVVFGTNSNVLEVEMNELQEIQKTLSRRLVRHFISDGITDLTTITYTNGVLNLAPGCGISIEGFIVECSGLTLEITEGTAYVQIWEETVSGESELNEGGNQQKGFVPNYISDCRMAVETTRRKVLKYTLSDIIVEDKLNLAIAEIKNGVLNILCKEVSVPSLLKALKRVADEAQENIIKHNTDITAHLDLRNAVAQALENATDQFAITIPSTGWVSDNDTSNTYALHVDIADSRITTNFIPNLTILPTGQETAKECYLGLISDTFDGFIRVYSDRVPSTPIPAFLTIWDNKSTFAEGSGGVIPPSGIATPEDVEDMLDDVFGSNDGSGSGNSGDVPPSSDVATPEDVEEMLDDVFGSK